MEIAAVLKAVGTLSDQVEVLDRIETELASRANELSVQEIGLIMTILCDCNQRNETPVRMQLLLSELKSVISQNIQSFSSGGFLGVYCSYLMSG